MKELIPGANTIITQTSFTLNYVLGGGADVSVFCLRADGRVQGDDGMIFYGMPTSSCGAVKLKSDGIAFELSLLENAIEKIAVTATVDNGDFSSVRGVSLSTADFICRLDTSGRQEAALILLEIYKRDAVWKVRFVGQGFNGGLKPLAEQYGVEIADSNQSTASTGARGSSEILNQASSAASSANETPVQLSKISLTKLSPTIDLTKKAGQVGLIKVNLNWTKGGGFFASGIDLDLGAYIELEDGTKQIVQALGNQLTIEPYIKLLGDDRTGANVDGEWLHINGDHLGRVTRITIFAFIYEGTPNWAKANAFVTLYVPEMPPIETRLTEGSNNKGFCAIADLSVTDGKVQVERLNRYFSGHEECDRAFGWGFRWRAGSK